MIKKLKQWWYKGDIRITKITLTYTDKNLSPCVDIIGRGRYIVQVNKHNN